MTNAIAAVWPTLDQEAARIQVHPATLRRAIYRGRAIRLHREHQRELLMANRTTYADHGLMFAKEPADLQTPRATLGQPCLALVRCHFRRVVTDAGVRPINETSLKLRTIRYKVPFTIS